LSSLLFRELLEFSQFPEEVFFEGHPEAVDSNSILKVPLGCKEATHSERLVSKEYELLLAIHRKSIFDLDNGLNVSIVHIDQINVV
jgi:hypothetical protein